MSLTPVDGFLLAVGKPVDDLPAALFVEHPHGAGVALLDQLRALLGVHASTRLRNPLGIVPLQRGNASVWKPRLENM